MFLIIPDELYSDEALESFLIRLYEANGFESFQLLSGAMWEWLIDNDHQAAGALPRQLNQINLYHAKHSSGFRLRAFQLLDSLLDSDARLLMQHALLHSAVTFSPHLTSVFRDGIHIPLCFVRSGYTPVCSACLAESSYIRQFWHLKPYQACHHHGVDMLFNCPSCEAVLDYKKTEQLTHCECGFDLRDASTTTASPEHIAIGQLVVEGDNKNALSITSWLGALLWFSRSQPKYVAYNAFGELELEQAVQYFANWPQSFELDLESVASKAEEKLVKGFNHTRFSDVFGELLVSSRKLPSSDIRQNFVLKAVIDFLQQLVRDNPKMKEPNIADLKLTVMEAAALLTTSTEQVYRLYEEGYLQSSIRLKLHSKLSPNDAVFFLRHVMELRWSGMASDYSSNDVYLPPW
ncbi:TniQ family protein [Photobacterium sp. DNB23_23_1]